MFKSDDHLIFGKPKNDLEKSMRQGLLKQRLDSNYEENDFRWFMGKIKHWIPIPIIVGIVAAIIYIKLGGVKKLVELLLGWTIGATLVATAMALIGVKHKAK